MDSKFITVKLSALEMLHYEYNENRFILQNAPKLVIDYSSATVYAINAEDAANGPYHRDLNKYEVPTEFKQKILYFVHCLIGLHELCISRPDCTASRSVDYTGTSLLWQQKIYCKPLDSKQQIATFKYYNIGNINITNMLIEFSKFVSRHILAACQTVDTKVKEFITANKGLSIFEIYNCLPELHSTLEQQLYIIQCIANAVESVEQMFYIDNENEIATNCCRDIIEPTYIAIPLDNISYTVQISNFPDVSRSRNIGQLEYAINNICNAVGTMLYRQEKDDYDFHINREVCNPIINIPHIIDNDKYLGRFMPDDTPQQDIYPEAVETDLFD